MSGTSLDGLDIALCSFTEQKGQWSFNIIATETYAYTSQWKARLSDAMKLSAEALLSLDRDIAEDYSDKIEAFLLKHKAESTVDLISSHGQTIYHNPADGITTQIGNAAIMVNRLGIDTVADLRTLDVALGGQGAPIVPMGEWHLFPQYAQFINLGGIANISLMDRHNYASIQAYDICPANGILNHLIAERNLAYDDKGKIAASGSLDKTLLDKLNAIKYYTYESPKTLDASFYVDEILPLIIAQNISLEDKLYTVTEHIAIQIGRALKPQAVCITGGGALNDFLISRIEHHTDSEVFIPSKEIIEFKEAIIIGFLGLLRYLDRPNVCASVTGASRDSSSGIIYKA